ncbi:MAG: nucleotidyl transferase AbiEii/AbiGii toxin family protein [Nitrospira sp.]|nr:nucleotidyl transferase AbiEii/AbiGii toxin family protein [Nitrospira sp.]
MAAHPSNLSASIHQRLLNHAKKQGRPLQELLQYFAIERFLFRLSQSPHATRFYLKGALMLRIWDAPLSRPTIDVDLMGRQMLSQDELEQVIKDICVQTVPDDGCRFEAATVQARPIRMEDQYGGIRVTFISHIGKMRLNMQVDVGFGDVIVPGPIPIDFPALLDFPSPHLLAYSPESAIAEKFQAMVMLDSANSRMKDFYDIWLLARGHPFEGSVVSHALQATFTRRQTAFPVDIPTALTDHFVKDRLKQTQWNAFVRKGHLAAEQVSLNEVVELLRGFLMPPMRASANSERFDRHWPPGGPWT